VGGNVKFKNVFSLVTLITSLLSLITPLAQSGEISNFIVEDLKILPSRIKVGEQVTVEATIVNTGNTSSSQVITFRVNNSKVASRNLSLQPGERENLSFKWIAEEEGVYLISVEDKTSFLIVEDEGGNSTSSHPKFRVGPMIRLRPTVSKVEVNKEGSVIELIISNPTLNDVDLHFDAWVSAPANFHIWGEGFSQAEAAGTIYGIFEVPPGGTRTIHLNAKAVRTGEYVIHFIGLYYPNGNKDEYNPVSLTHPIKVVNSLQDNGSSHPPRFSLPGFELVLFLFGLALLICYLRKK